MYTIYTSRLVVLCVHVPPAGDIVCTCTCIRLVVLCVHVPQVGCIVCTCIYMYILQAIF